MAAESTDGSADYAELRITFAPADDGYVAEAQAVDRQAAGRFVLPVGDDVLLEVIEVGRQRTRGQRDIGVVDPPVGTGGDAIEEFGGSLASALFDGPIGRLYDEVDQAARAEGRGVRLTLAFDPARTPELLNVPWEFLYWKRTYLSSLRRTPVVRFLDVGQAAAPRRIDGRVRMLGVIANPRGDLDVGGEKRRIEQAVEEMTQTGRLELTWVEGATRERLREALKASYHIVHFVGHSDFDESSGASILLLEREGGGEDPVDDEVLHHLLGDQVDTLQLAVLNSCEGSRASIEDPLAGVATTLVGLGIPAVVAMQFEISDAAALAFAKELYTSLVRDHRNVDAAVSEARKAVLTSGNDREWATPVLFLNQSSGRLFEFGPGAEAPASAPPDGGGAHPPDGPAPPADVRPPEGAKPRRGRVWVVAAVVAAIAVGLIAWLFTASGGDDADEVVDVCELVPPDVLANDLQPLYEVEVVVGNEFEVVIDQVPGCRYGTNLGEVLVQVESFPDAEAAADAFATQGLPEIDGRPDALDAAPDGGVLRLEGRHIVAVDYLDEEELTEEDLQLELELELTIADTAAGQLP